jgi:hypothetical protein
LTITPCHKFWTGYLNLKSISITYYACDLGQVLASPSLCSTINKQESNRSYRKKFSLEL